MYAATECNKMHCSTLQHSATPFFNDTRVIAHKHMYNHTIINVLSRVSLLLASSLSCCLSCNDILVITHIQTYIHRRTLWCISLAFVIPLLLLFLLFCSPLHSLALLFTLFCSPLHSLALLFPLLLFCFLSCSRAFPFCFPLSFPDRTGALIHAQTLSLSLLPAFSLSLSSPFPPSSLSLAFSLARSLARSLSFPSSLSLLPTCSLYLFWNISVFVCCVCS